jgi:hypothetical protein
MECIMARDVLLVGSVGLSNAEDVFLTVAQILGEKAKRISDGETGYARSVWIQCQIPFFLRHPQLEMVEPDPERPGEHRQARIPSGGIYSHTRAGSYHGRASLRAGVRPEDLRFEHVGYGDWAIESYATFKRLKSEGVIPTAARFQVSIPSPRAVLNSRVMPEAFPAVSPACEGALANDIRRIADVVPADELAIQWDCTEPVTWDRLGQLERRSVIETLVRVGGFVPEGVELGYHLCYGDFEHVHGRQPPDTREMTEITNAIVTNLGRRVDWVHMPVPRDRSDHAYFASLDQLKLGSETRIYLGVVHYTDGVEGAKLRISAAQKAIRDFGIATECGFGRRPKDQDIRDLLALYVKVAEL